MTSARAINFGLLLSLGASCAAFGEQAPVCELAAQRGGLAGYVVQVDPDKEGRRILKADIDLDGTDDELRWSEPGSGSLVPAESALLTLSLTSNGKSFTLEQQRLSVVKFESRYYAVTTRLESAIGPWQKEVFVIARQGIERICALAGKGQAP